MVGGAAVSAHAQVADDGPVYATGRDCPLGTCLVVIGSGLGEAEVSTRGGSCRSAGLKVGGARLT